MIEQKSTWRAANEGNLARTWEQRLQPRVNPSPRRRQRVLAPWVRPVAWIAGLWLAALVPSFLAVRVITMSYQYDQSNQQYAALARQSQALSASVAQKASPAALAKDAARLKVALVEPRTSSPQVAKSGPGVHRSPFAKFTAWVNQLSLALAR